MGFARGSISDISVYWGSEFEYKMLSYYFNIHRLPYMTVSPLRIDHRPSFQFYTSSKGKVRWSDYGTGEWGDIWTLLSKYWGIPMPEVEKRVQEDAPRIQAQEQNIDVLYTKSAKGSSTHAAETDLQVRTRDWRDYDLSYWESYGISKPWLIFGDVHPISHVIITKNGVKSVIPADRYAYAFVEFKEGKPTIKVYQPFSKAFKWINKHDISVWDLWTKLPEKGDKLIITSSRKDALSIWENTGIPSTSLQGEGMLPKAHVVAELSSRYKEIYVLYDNDFRSEINYGHEYGKRFANAFGLTQIEIPTEWHKKDPTDLCAAHGRKVLREVILGLINKTEILTGEETPF